MPAPTFRRFGKTDQDIPTVTEQVTTPTKTGGPNYQPLNQRSSNVRPNKFGGKCINCGTYVQAEAGALAGKVDNKWTVKHLDGDCVDSTVEQHVEPTREQTVVNGEVVFDGVYTLETAEGHRTFRLRTQKTDAEFMPGKQIAQYLVGADNDSDYASFGHVVGGTIRIWKRHAGNEALAADAKAFMANPHSALKSTSCYACGRTLTVPASVHNGLGPECARKGR